MLQLSLVSVTWMYMPMMKRKVVFQIALWPDLWQSAVAIRVAGTWMYKLKIKRVPIVVFHTALWPDLWQSAAAIRVSAP